MLLRIPGKVSRKMCLRGSPAMIEKFVTRRSAVIFAILLSLTFARCAAAQQNPDAANKPVIGSSDTVTADPPVAHPNTKPCVVSLFSNLEFADFNIKPFDYAPPAKCVGPWAKVILVLDFNETTGNQFDRTAEITIGNVNVYFGTTPEPSSTLAPTWHVERDLTDYSALLKTAQAGQANLGNLVNATFTGIIFGNAEIEFYPADRFNPAPQTADLVLPLPDAPGGAVQLASTSSLLSQTFTLPENIERAYLDVIAQSQNVDEFWYTCSPNDLVTETENTCGNTGFRETEISIDGEPAGVAPVYPWIYTGGLDPFLWFPLPGVQTLNFVPYRVDLTPFAGVLSNGLTHTVSISVFNADNYFSTTGTLLLYLDRGARQVTGEVTENTIGSGPNPKVTEDFSTVGGNVTGTATVTSGRQFTLAGYVKTSHGRVDTTVQQELKFSNTQQYSITATVYTEDINQTTTVTSKTTTRDGFLLTEVDKDFSYPLVVDFSEVENADGTFSLPTTIQQKFSENETVKLNGFPIYARSVSNSVAPTDTLELDASFNLLGNEGQASSQDYVSFDSLGGCYSKKLTAANNVLTEISSGEGCGGGAHH
jgi:Peptide N-acetyl-beta-D-glucosaminyl asparaginase amidase A